MSKHIPLEEKLKKVLTAKPTETRKKNKLPPDLRTIPKKQRKKGIKVSTSKRGRICGANHFSFDPEKVKKQRELIKIGCLKKDIFYMVDGIISEECEIMPMNTNSGVLFEHELPYLQ